jgi:hypothetical protein
MAAIALAVLPEWYFSRDEEILAETGELRRLLEASKVNRADELQEKYPLGYALVFTDGRRYTYEDSKKGDLVIDWSEIRLIGYTTGSLTLDLPRISLRESPNFSVNAKALRIPTIPGTRIPLLALKRRGWRFLLEVLSAENDVVGVVFGVTGGHAESGDP